MESQVPFETRGPTTRPQEHAYVLGTSRFIIRED